MGLIDRLNRWTRFRYHYHDRLERRARQWLHSASGEEFDRAQAWVTELALCPDHANCDHVRGAGR